MAGISMLAALVRSGILEQANGENLVHRLDIRTDNIATTTNPASRVVSTTSSAALTGSDISEPLSQPPSLLWKAYAQALRPWLTLAPNLSAINQAMFLASPLQPGIPGNDIVPEEVTNYQQFLKADCMQLKNAPIYTLENGSYFENLWAYLRNVQPSPATDQLEDIRSRLTAAKSAKDKVFERAFREYQRLEGDDKHVPFVDWLRRIDSEYSKAWEAEDALEKTYESLQDQSLDDVLRALATIKSADSKTDFKIQSNMPCIVTDKHYYVPFRTDPAQATTIDPNTRFYRPYHMLSNYRATAQQWLSKFDPADYSANRTEIPLDFETARSLDWAALGHGGLHKDVTSNPTDEIYSSITAKLSWVGLQAFDVDRGLWDVKKPRNMQLGPKTPEVLSKPFLRTTKLLLGYGVDLMITLPVAVTAEDITRQNTIISLLGVPITSRSIQGNELHISARDNAYPVLLAVLAQQA